MRLSIFIIITNLVSLIGCDSKDIIQPTSTHHDEAALMVSDKRKNQIGYILSHDCGRDVSIPPTVVFDAEANIIRVQDSGFTAYKCVGLSRFVIVEGPDPGELARVPDDDWKRISDVLNKELRKKEMDGRKMGKLWDEMNTAESSTGSPNAWKKSRVHPDSLIEKGAAK